MGIFSTSINVGANAGMAKKQFEYDKQMAAIQNQYNIDMWKMQQDYNTPANQMQRFVDAGLSPNLVYEQISPGNATSAPEQVAAGRKAPNLGVFNFDDTLGIGKVLGILSGIQGLRGAILDNMNKASELEGKQLLGQELADKVIGSFGDVVVEGKRPLRDRIYDWFMPHTKEGTRVYYKHVAENNAVKIPEARTSLMSGQKEYLSTRKAYQGLVNDWFKTDKIFNYVNSGFRTIGGFVPKLKVERPQYNGRSY